MSANRKTIIVLVLLALTAAFSTASNTTYYGKQSSRAAPINFVGTFYGENSRTITYHSDGTMSLVLADMFSDDPTLISAGRRQTPFLGVWRKVDVNKIRVTSLSFVTEAFGHRYGPDGLILKTKWLAIFDDPVKGISPSYTAVNVVVEVFSPDQNPTSDEPVIVVPLPNSRAYRLKAE